VKTQSGQTTPEELYKDIDAKFKDQMISIERNKRDAQDKLNQLKWRHEQRGKELGTAVGNQAAKDQAALLRKEKREIERLEATNQANVQLGLIRSNQEQRSSGKYAGLDPASIEDSMNTLYSGLQTQIGKDGIFTPDDMLDYAEKLGGVYADNADQIALKLTTLFTTFTTGEGFLTALGDQKDDIYIKFLMEEGMPTADAMQQLHLLSLSGDVQTNQTGAIDVGADIQNILKGLPPLVRRNK
jgi:hypothetical protein